uniref:Uncharacterized protein n=1 Tax=Candidatus Kentrum sp. FW TaxID=2126338 RepID=A0A450T3S5_9GAMM|nr:MAG: hypothetical protein BECKFW1821A_GA0114235_103020 [Candidatus Kentron sp. FW]VFJ61249.1 MAG: hypothetical protein BECKFW1821B_GA0114236_106412 [Candidatus Kentron sp. FW]
MDDDVIIKTLEMTRRIRDGNHEKLSGKSPRERISFYREKARRLYEKIGRPLREPSSEFY